LRVKVVDENRWEVSKGLLVSCQSFEGRSDQNEETTEVLSEAVEEWLICSRERATQPHLLAEAKADALGCATQLSNLRVAIEFESLENGQSVEKQMCFMSYANSLNTGDKSYPNACLNLEYWSCPKQ
jgi:hypothetical protein